MNFLSRTSILTAGFATLALLSLAACGDDVNQTYADEYNPAAVVDIAPVPPPAPSDEAHDVIQDPRIEVWRPGHWIYESQRFVWVSGEVLTKPSATAVWSPDRWERRSYGWVFIHGYWQ